jgi:hypothetical protein
MSTRRTKYLALTGVALFLLVVVGGVWLVEDIVGWISPKPTYSCTGSGTAKLLKEVIESGPLSKILNISAYQVDNNHELSHEDNRLLCIADIQLSSRNNKSIRFTIERADDGSIRLQTIGYLEESR